VAGQMALSTVLLVVAALFLRSLQHATRLDVGFDTGPAAVVTVEAWASELTPEERSRFAGEFLREVRSQPGVMEAGITTRLPLDLGVTNAGFDIPGVEPPPDQDAHLLEFAYVTDGYLEAMGIGLMEGRGIQESDRTDGQRVVVVTRALADRYWPGESAVGRTLFRSNDPVNGYLVVGVAEDAKIWSLTEAPRPYMYMASAQGSGFGRYHLVARVNGPPAEAARTLGALATRLEPQVFVSGTETMDDHLAYIYFLPRMGALLLVLVGALAVSMACVGLYGMVSYSVSRRTREMGIRLALGAERGRVVALVVRSGLGLVAVGAVLGLVVALSAGFLVEGFLIGVATLDPLALLSAPLLLGAVAGLAAYLPARRAARVDPVEALRSE
jgi:predicted permease